MSDPHTPSLYYLFLYLPMLTGLSVSFLVHDTHLLIWSSCGVSFLPTPPPPVFFEGETEVSKPTPPPTGSI